MEDALQMIKDKKIETCKNNLILNQFKVDICNNSKEALEIAKNYMKNEVICAVGGSVTLTSIGLIEALELSKEINYLDRYHCDDVKQILRESLLSDVYFTSSNAITLNGELYNVDGNGNRVAALTYGPKKVVVIVGQNKLVDDVYQADHRLKTIAAPSNCLRLNKETPCAKVGHCMDCKSVDRICSSFVTTKRSHEKERIHVIIVKEDLGY